MRIKIVTGGGWCSCECDLFSGCPFKTDTTGVPPNLPGPDCLGDGDYEVIAEHELAAMREVIRAAVAWRTAEVHYFKGVLDDNDAQAKAQRETRWCEKKHELRKRLDAFVQDYGRVNRD